MENTPMEQARQDFSLSKTSENFANSLVLVKDCPEEEIKKPIRYAMMLVGLRAANVPTGPEKTILFNFIQENYPDYYPEEIKYAFEKAMARKFDDLDVRCFENFSCEYVGRVLAAYEAWSGHDTKVFGGHYYFDKDAVRCKIQAYYERFSSGSAPEHYPPVVYRMLAEDGLIKPLTGPKSRRVYPKQLEILKLFKKCAEKGIPQLYIQV
jgi:hypothetical protein